MNTFSKLSTGDWAVRSPKELTPGSKVEVVLKSGGTKMVTVGGFITWNNDAAFYAIVAEPKTEAPKIAVGDLAGIIALFNKARSHLNFPKVTLEGIRVSVAGPNAKVPGSLSIVSSTKNQAGQNDWFGRVLKDGNYQPSKAAPAFVAERLREFAANPAAVAARYGKLNGVCCFCGIKLGPKDASKKPSATALKSLAVGYGKDCAEHFGLPWGEVSGDFEVRRAA